MQATRRHAKAVGLLVCVPVLLLGARTGPGVAAGRRGPARRCHFGQGAWGATSPGYPRAPRCGSPGTLADGSDPGPRGADQAGLHQHRARQLATVRRVGIRIIRIDAPRADTALPCSRTDFRIRQMPNRTLLLPRRQATDLAKLGVPLRAWPRLKLRNRPGNQDGCKGARLTLGYRAYGAPRS